MAVLSPLPKLQFFDNNGHPLVGGKLYTYQAGTTTPLTSFVSSSGLVPNTNPVILNARGECDVWLNTAAPYKLRLTTATDVDIWTVDNIGQSDTSVLALLAASTGSQLVGYTYGASPAVPRTVAARLRDDISVKDYGAVGNGVADDTTAIQNAIDAADARGTLAGKVYFPNGVYKISSSLVLCNGVTLDLGGSTIRQVTNNIPVIKVPTGADVYWWAVENGILEFATQQTSAQTSGVGILAAKGKFSYNFAIRHVQVNFACDGFVSDGSSGSFLFIGVFEHALAVQCARWGFNIDCDAAIGANTNLVFTNCWTLQQDGSEISTSRGFRFRACSQSRWNTLFADHLQGPFLEMESCTGTMGCVTPESCDFRSTASTLAVITLADCHLTIDALRFIANTYTVGSNDIYMVRTTSSGVPFPTRITSWLANANVYNGTLANLYEINPSANTSIFNDVLQVDRTPQYADGALPYKIARINGVDRTETVSSGKVIYNNTAPTSGTWVAGDRCVSTVASSAAPVVEWVCVLGGTPGTWRACRWVVGRDTTANRPAGMNLTHTGVGYLDITIAVAGAPITWNGAAWVNSAGAVV